MRNELWTPLKTFVRKLKETEYGNTGKSYYDFTTIVLASEFGRTVGGSIKSILANSDLDEAEKRTQILSQDISAHNPVNSCAFLGRASAMAHSSDGSGRRRSSRSPSTR